MTIDPVFDPSITISPFQNGCMSILYKILPKLWLVLSCRQYLKGNRVSQKMALIEIFWLILKVLRTWKLYFLSFCTSSKDEDSHHSKVLGPIEDALGCISSLCLQKTILPIGMDCYQIWLNSNFSFFSFLQDHTHLLYSTIPRMQEPGQIVETYTEEDPEGAMSVVSVETSDDGTTRRTETTVS